MKLINDLPLSIQEGTFPFEDRDKNIRDVLIHLYEWHSLILNWINKNDKENIPTPFIPLPYNWGNYGDMNVEFWKKHQDTSLEEAKELLSKSHKEVLNVIDTYPNEALFTKKYYSWTGTTSLGSYCVSATSSHYDWAIKKIRKYTRETK